MAVIEFAFMFNALLSIGHASRDAALVAAEAGNSAAADCVILRTIEADVTAPASTSRITTVLIYRTDKNGSPLNSNSYTRTGVAVDGDPNSTSCLLADQTKVVVPYKATSTGYPAGQVAVPPGRCNIVSGCPAGAPTPLQTLDTIGVKISYQHQWVTPFGFLFNFVTQAPTNGGPPVGPLLVQSNTNRMEPVL
jgi:hypothetical protein